MSRTTVDPTAANALDERLVGTRMSNFWRELWGNSAHFPLANLFFEIVTEGRELLFAPDAYVLVIAAVVQAWVASKWQRAGTPRPMLANLLGPLVYLTLETGIEGVRFFSQPNHLIYLAFGAGVGSIRWALARVTSERWRLGLLLIEGLSRGVVLLLMYAALESRNAPDSIKPFFADQSHFYITLALVALGLLIGLLAYFEQRTQTILRETAASLRQLSEWSFGRDLTSRAVIDADALSMRTNTVCVMFMDLRGFTRWSEARSPGDVVKMLNAFYGVVDRSLEGVETVIKLKFTADEAMVVFREPYTAIHMATKMRVNLADFLNVHGLSIGIGLHYGPTVQGLFGSERVRLFDVVGDTVNVAKRLCDSAEGGQILVSEYCYLVVQDDAELPISVERRTLHLKGKTAPFSVILI